jgi:hypothetical protein
MLCEDRSPCGIVSLTRRILSQIMASNRNRTFARTVLYGMLRSTEWLCETPPSDSVTKLNTGWARVQSDPRDESESVVGSFGPDSVGVCGCGAKAALRETSREKSTERNFYSTNNNP